VNIKNRVKELRTVRASTVRPNPKNWRTHNDKQRDALKGVLAQIGYAVPAIVRELPDGSLMLIDGHLRTETLGDAEISVALLDVTEDEADLLLATIDPLSTLAGQDDSALVELLQGVSSESAAVMEMLGALVKLPEEGGDGLKDTEPVVVSKFQIIVDCPDDTTQAQLLEELMGRGLTVKSLIS
jgi:ParB-like chromosome segregation protein Spo0J